MLIEKKRDKINRDILVKN